MLFNNQFGHCIEPLKVRSELLLWSYFFACKNVLEYDDTDICRV